MSEQQDIFHIAGHDVFVTTNGYDTRIKNDGLAPEQFDEINKQVIGVLNAERGLEWRFSAHEAGDNSYDISYHGLQDGSGDTIKEAVLEMLSEIESNPEMLLPERRTAVARLMAARETHKLLTGATSDELSPLLNNTTTSELISNLDMVLRTLILKSKGISANGSGQRSLEM